MVVGIPGNRSVYYVGSAAGGVREFVRHGENGFLVAARDHGDVRRRIEELHRDRGRLAAMGQAIATLSHHIKNILQGIRGGSYLIEEGLKEDDNDVVRRGWRIRPPAGAVR